MYTNQQLYYLEQLGIRPWVLKTKTEDKQPNSIYLFHDQQSKRNFWRHLRHLLEAQGYSVEEGQELSRGKAIVLNFTETKLDKHNSQSISCPRIEDLLSSAQAKRELMLLLRPLLKDEETCV